MRLSQGGRMASWTHRDCHSGVTSWAGYSTESYLANKLKNCDVALFIRTETRAVAESPLGDAPCRLRWMFPLDLHVSGAEIWLSDGEVLIPHRKSITGSWLSTSCFGSRTLHLFLHLASPTLLLLFSNVSIEVLFLLSFLSSPPAVSVS